MLDAADRATLLSLARRSIAAGQRGHGPAPPPREAWTAPLRATGASFTTLTLGGELRGCCGTVDAHQALAEDVWSNAWASAYADPRFPPLAPAELDRLGIAVSVLSTPEPIEVAGERELIAALRPGIDGVVIASGGTRATFLPSVWESLPEPAAFIAQLKRKAGWHDLPADARFFRYRTETFR